jgi:hypothetical protein
MSTTIFAALASSLPRVWSTSGRIAAPNDRQKRIEQMNYNVLSIGFMKGFFFKDYLLPSVTGHYEITRE